VQFRKSIQGVTAEGLKLLMNYAWPGNIRELKNAIERAMILVDRDRIDVDQLPIRISEPVDSGPGTRSIDSHPVRLPAEGAGLDDIERELIQQALQYAHGNKSLAAKLLKVSRDTLRYKVKKHNLE
jgi:DNA-binding NtrC family response regulator